MLDSFKYETVHLNPTTLDVLKVNSITQHSDMEQKSDLWPGFISSVAQSK